MTVRDLARLYEYSYWANARLFLVIETLTPAQYTQTVAGSYGSIRNTLVHMLSAEWAWLERCGGHVRGGPLVPEDFPTLAALVAQWTQVEGWMRAFLAGLTDDDTQRLVEFANPRGERRSMPLGEMLQHAANHNVHHRGQVTLLLRMLGTVPGSVDLIVYDAERRHVSLW
jgi:uncharacterized damage-inducible protein DinB